MMPTMITTPGRRAALQALCLLVVLGGLSTLVQGPPSVAGTRRPPGGDGPGTGEPRPAALTRLETVLIRVPKPYTAVVREIGQHGGIVTQQYRHFDGLAARVPRSALAAIEAITGPGSISKDLIVEATLPPDLGFMRPGAPPAIGDARSIEAESADAIAGVDLPVFAAAHPQGYLLNDSINNAAPLHAAGITGAGVIVGVIDSGIRPGSSHITLDGSVIGGEDFVEDGLGFSNAANDGHGTFVAGMISANAKFRFNVASNLYRAVQAYAPDSIVPPNICVGGPNPGVVCVTSATCGIGTCTGAIPMIGSAPLAGIYALRVFGPDGGAPLSRILRAIDRAIELRERYEAGLPDGIDIQVVNMSLGGASLYPGRDFLDRGVAALLEHDIVAVAAAGNAGPSGLTIGSPGSSLGTITVGAASLAHNERIVRDLQFGFTGGAAIRPSGGAQTAYFSARGPNADGRGDPDLVANGDWCYSQGFSASSTTVNFASGTSFSAPTVAGVAALLRQAVPSATARQIHNAIIASARSGLLADGSTVLDQGAGYVDALAARDLLLTGTVPDALTAPPASTHTVRDNVEDLAGLSVLTKSVERHIGPLRPGGRGEILYQVQPNTARVLLTLSNVTLSLPPEQQNRFFGDDVFLTVHSAKTSLHSSRFGGGDYLLYAFTRGRSAAFADPEPGLMRITLSGSWTNAGDVSADVAIESIADPMPQFTRQGKVEQSESILVPIAIGPGVSAAEFRLAFREDWSNYPVSDLDLMLIRPDGGVDFRGATLAAPERVVVSNPMPGTWTAVINGFEVHVPSDKYELRVSLDGTVVH